MDWGAIANAAVQSVLFSLIGVLFFGLAFWLIAKLSPFSVRKEIEEDQNVALAILIGSVILGVALIISAALLG